MRALAVSTWIEVKLFLREPLTVVFTLALPLLFLFVLGGIFGNTADPAVFRGAGPLDFYVPGYLALVWTAVGLLAFPVQIARYREDGVLRRFRASGAPMRTVFGSQIAVAFLVSAVGAVLVIGSATVVYDIRFPQSVGGVLVAWFLCGILFSALGLLLSCIPSSRGALRAGLGLFFVMMLLSGVRAGHDPSGSRAQLDRSAGSGRTCQPPAAELVARPRADFVEAQRAFSRPHAAG